MYKLYDSIGSTYGVTRRADPAIAQEILQLVHFKDGSQFLDVACGAGNYTCALAASGGQWHGTDISEVMLNQAVEKNSSIHWKVSSAEKLPYQDGLFDGVVCSLAIHHFAELGAPFKEVWRVMNRGRFVIFTAFPEQMQNYWLCHYFPEMLRRACLKMPTKQSVVTALQLAGFGIEKISPFFVTNQLQDLFLYSGKERPELYLDPSVRANISSFASLCSVEELQEGIHALRADIEDGRFREISQRYESTAGDYAFIVASKGVRAES
jgi:ubiquinone/menaquinone biosynthesis C-methylase UbiE